MARSRLGGENTNETNMGRDSFSWINEKKKPGSETSHDPESYDKSGLKENSFSYTLIQACRLLGTL